MAYATYTTRAVVCGSKDSYTSDRSYLLFTEEAGMLWASARSVREEKSKQRYALQDFSSLRVSLVKGKTGWKIGSAEALGNPFMKARSRSERAFITHVVRQLRRYLHGEEPVRTLFSDVWELFSAPLLETEIEVKQLLFTFRMLYSLGYINPSKDLVEIAQSDTLATATKSFRPEMQKVIEKISKTGETVSHL